MRTKLSVRSFEDLGRELDTLGLPSRVRASLSRPVGFTNFYNAYRNTSRRWIQQNSRRVLSLFRQARHLADDLSARDVYKQIESLPRIPSGGRTLSASSLLTPVVACLDPRTRCPVINGNENVSRRLRVYGLASRDLVAQFDGLVGLINQDGFADAFELDASEVEPTEARRRPVLAPPGNQQGHRSPTRPLAEKDAREVQVLQRTLSTRYKRLHNRMTNKLDEIMKRFRLICEEGTNPACRFDARVVNYDGRGRDLLIEAKSWTQIELCRMAVGQLLDYRRRLLFPARTDLAALFPRSPSNDSCEYLRGVGVRVLWFNASMTKIRGDWTPRVVAV
jgi:hypothetical protein